MDASDLKDQLEVEWLLKVKLKKINFLKSSAKLFSGFSGGDSFG